MTTQYKMLSNGFLSRFKSFMASENRNPEGAFDAMPKAVTRKDPNMKHRFVPVPHCGGTLFLRERSANLAFDEAGEAQISDPAKRVLAFLKDKLDEDTLHEVSEMLKAEAGVPTDLEKKSNAKIEAAEARRAGAQDVRRRQLAADASANASSERMADFAARFPGAARIGHI